MIIKDFMPSAELKEFVRCYRIVHFEFDKNVCLPTKAYPPKPEKILHFFLKDPVVIEGNNGIRETHSPVLLKGQRTLVNTYYNSIQNLNFQVVFQPAALYRLTGIPNFELTNQFLQADQIFSKSIWFTFEQLQQASSYQDMLSIGDKLVRSLTRFTRKEPHMLDTVAHLITQTDGNISLDKLARESCLSPRHFKRKFNERIGINPKTFARIVRFNKAFNLRNRYQNMDWLRIALECGYYDYQHLVKDYRDFTLLTPNAFHFLESKSPEMQLGLADDIYRSRYEENLKGV